MEFLRFIFSSFWVWLGFIILVGAVGGVLVALVKACKRNRKISGYRVGQRWKLDVENASADDAHNAFIAVTCALDGEPEQEQEVQGNV
ncbi:MAG: hypothetical protein HFJ35_08485 [Clostridia bacterium]|nr:hypothetical protein [Clostridia bacterium]